MSAQPRPPPPQAAGEEFGLAKGATVGRYVVLGLLGRGGMVEVYAAYDPDLDRKIALKLLRARGGSNDADGRTRLLREAQAIARLSHPNVVVVFDVGTFRESVFIAMEFVEGNTLGYWIEAQNRSWREVLDVYVAAGRGLVAAHAAGLVHRDFKPENVMITKSGQVRVMDFGLAREQGAVADRRSAAQLAADVAEQAAALAEAFESGVDGDATARLGSGDGGGTPSTGSGGYLKLKLTQTGAMLGTPAYMAPEQFAGTGGDARTDQFSFCVALYEGLYRQRPFPGNNALTLMANVVAGTVSEPPPEARVPTWIRKILLRGLSTSPEGRFPSMTELLAALGQDPAVRRRRWVGAAAGVAVLLAATTGARRFVAGNHSLCAAGPDRAATAWSRDRRAAVERAFAATGSKNAPRALAGVSALMDEYVARWTGMYKETCEATHVRGEQSAEVLDLRMGCLGERLSSVRALGDVFMTADRAVVDNAVSAASALPALDRCADVEMLRAVVKPPDNPAVRAKVASLREEIAKVKALGDSGQCDKATSLGPTVVTAAKALAYLPVEAEANFAIGRLAETCIDPNRGIGYLDDAAVAAEASRDEQLYVEATVTMAAFYADRLHDVRRARDAIRHGEAVLSRLPGHPGLEAWVAEDKAIVAMTEGRYEDAITFERRSLELRQQIYGPSHYEVSTGLNNLALDLHGLHRDVEAEPLLSRAVDMATNLFGPESTRTALFLMNQGEVLMSLGRFDAAHVALDRAITNWKRQNAGSSLIGYGMLDLGRLQIAEGEPAAAVKTIEGAIQLLGRDDRMLLAEANFALARAVWALPSRGRQRAINLAREARELAADQFGSAHLLDEIQAWESAHRHG
ncbi:MAG: serine/threonine-protein kinase [Verrucomicrobiota bacterium]